ncbi:MAG: DUF1501 domain-containing protein [Phycisphaerales bacterium]|jgi:uncharacterized protein (DUF1501 family)|nr:DUF1501 domain-containing protein [Phycisphaerales bacterium]
MSLHLNPSEASAFTRREFLGTGLVLASAAATVPQFINASAAAMPRAAAGLASIPGVDEDRVLVVIQLSGGNDGLNTVVPFAMDDYYRVRPGIAVRKDEVLELGRGQDVGLHPAMAGIKSLYDEGLAAIVQGVGYPNPNRSHFTSMDIWHTADPSASGNGWLGRYIDAQCCGYGKGESGTPEQGALLGASPAVEPAISIGRTAPLALQGQKLKPISFESPELFRWTGADVHDDLVAPYDEIQRRGFDGVDAAQTGVSADSNAAFLMRTALDAQVAGETIRKAVSQRPLVQYPGTGLARQLSMVASMIRAGMKTRVFYVSHGSFDTHAGQGGANGQHANLLRQLADATRAFYADLKEQGNADRVLTMSFSEFGRRVAQNASGGTDHGTAAPMYFFGPMVRAGVIGRHPSLTDLDDGDLKFGLDFRSVYAGVLGDWLQADAKEVLGRTFKPAKIVRA